MANSMNFQATHKPALKPGALIIFCFMALNIFCGPKQNLSPVDVLMKSREAYSQKKPKEFLSLISEKALARLESRIKQMRKSFSTLPKNSLEGLADRMNLSASKLKRLTLHDYLRYVMENENMGLGSDNLIFPVHELNPAGITDKTENEDRYTIEFENGSVLIFLKENETWKIDEYREAKPAD